MGQVTKTMRRLGAALFASAACVAAAPAQAQATNKADENEFLYALVDAFAHAQARNSPEYRAAPNQLTENRLVRQIYLATVDQHEVEGQKLSQDADLVSRQGLEKIDDCHQRRYEFSAFVERENLLRDYDRQVISGAIPGPRLRDYPQIKDTNDVIDRYVSVLTPVCSKLAAN